MRMIAKNKPFNVFVVMATIAWTIGIAGIFTPLFPANAAVTVVTDNRIPTAWMMSGGMMQVVAGFKITASASEQLQSIKVRFEDIGTSGATPATMLAAFNAAGAGGANDSQGLCVYKDTNSNGGFEPGGSIDSVVAWENQPTWTDNGNGTYDTTLDIANQALPTSYATGYNYFVHMRMATQPPSGKSFRLTFLTGVGGTVVTSGTSPSITAFSTGALTSMGDNTGGWKQPPHISKLTYLNYKQLKVVFDKNMASASTNCDENANPGSCGPKYTLHTKATDTEAIFSAAVDAADHKNVVLTAYDNTRISKSSEDWLQITTDPSQAPKDEADSMPFSSNYNAYPMLDMPSVVISEVKLAGANTTDEFIELYSKNTINVNNWTVKAFVGGTYTTLATLGNVSLTPGKYYLLANNANNYHLNVNGAAMAADATFTGVDLAAGDTIFLLSATNAVVDMVGLGAAATVYEGSPFTGTVSAHKSAERKAMFSSTAATMESGGADITGGNGYDSDINSWDFVLRTTADPQNFASTAETPGGGGVNTAPTIIHMPIVNSTAFTELKMPAKINDTQEPFASLTTKLCYKASNVANWPESPTCVNGQMMTDVVFTIPASAVTSAGIDYYIYATDSMNATNVACQNPSATTIANAQSSPYHINVSTSSGSRSVSGYVKQSNCTTAISNATVYLEGTGNNAISDANGLFTINNVPDGIFNLKATSGGYLDGQIWGVSVNSNNPVSSGWTFCLQAGSAGLGGDLDSPGVMYTAPMEGMMGAPADIVIDKMPIVIGLDKAIDSTTAVCTNCNAANANIKLKKMSGGSMTNLTGYSIGVDTGSGVTLEGITRSFGGTATYPVIVIEQVTLLENGTQYVVELTPAVKDSAGNAISGNRIGGGHEFMFTVGATDMKDFGGGAGYVFTEGESNYMTGGSTFWNSMKNDAGYMDMSANYNAATGNWAGGAYNPPYILGSIPAPGAWNIPLNGDIVFSFSEAMDSNSVNRGTFELYSVANNVETNVTSTLINSATLSSDKEQVTMDVAAGGLTANTQYRLKVKNGVRSSSGITLGPPASPDLTFFVSDFNTGSGNDSAAPTITGSWPDNAATNVSNLGFIDIGMNEVVTTVNSSTVNLMSGATEVPSTVEFDPMAKSIRVYPTVGLMAGATYTVQLIGGSTGINDLAGNDFVTTTRTFTMSTTVDTTKPRVEFSNCDDYSCAITFSKAMNAAKATDTNRWTSSVVNPANYTIQHGAAGTTAYTIPNAASFTWDNKVNTLKISGLAINGQYNIVVAGVVDLSSNPIDTDHDTASGNILSSANTQGFVGPGGGGMMGAPMAGGAAMTGPTGFGSFTAMDKGMGMAAGVFPLNSMAGATTTYIIDYPIAPSGSTTNRLDNGATIKITLPQGFDVSSVIPDPYNPNKTDLNMMGPSTVTLKTSGVTDDGSSAATKGGAANDGVTVSGQTVTLHLSVLDGGVASYTGDPDFLHLEIKGIINSKIPKDFNSEGYSIDMKSYTAANKLVESKTSMPFFIAASGTNNITVNITAESGNGTFSLMMGSPMSGPQDATVTMTNGTGAQTWSNLPNGCYNLFTEPTITLGANKYNGQMNPEPLCLPGSGVNWNAATSTLTKALTFVKYGAGNSTTLTVKVTGTFSATGEDVDIFAGGPSGYNVETKTLTGAVTNNETTVYLPANGSYMIGMGPAMPKGPKMGPPPMPDWMPPMSVNIEVSGIGGTPVIKRMDTGAAITELSFTINSANKQIIGRVVSSQTTLSANYTANATTLSLTSAAGFLANDAIVLYDGTNTASGKISSISGTTVTLLTGISQGFSTGAKVYNVMANAEVFANQPMGFGGAGSHTQSKADGSFVLKVAMNGVYDLGVFKPGYGESPSRTVSVANNNAGTVDNNSTADISANNALVTTAAPLIIRIGRPDYTISGKISDISGNALQYAHVQAKEATTYQMVHSGTDTDGNYVLGVSAGTWVITADMPPGTNTCGTFTKTVPVSTESKFAQNIQPTSITCYTISGTVTFGGTAQANIPIGVETWDVSNDRPSGGYHRNEMTDISGLYSIKVGAGTYRVSTWTPEYGEIGQNVTVTSANVTSDISYDASQLKTLTLSFTGGTSSMRGFVEAKGTTGTSRRGMPIVDLSVTKTMSLPSGTYKVMVFVDGLGDFSPSSNVTLTSDQTVTINLSGQILYTVSGTILDASDNVIANAGVIVTSTTTGLTERATTDANGNYSLSVKADTYKIKAEQQDYDTPAKAEITVSANLDYDFDANLTGEGVAVNNPLQAKTAEISGTIYKSDGTTPEDNGIVFASTSDGKYVKTSIQKDGTYILPVSDGTWTVKADASLHAATTMSSTVVVAGADQAGKNVTLTADATDIKKADTITITPSVGGSIDDSDNTGIEMNFGAGVLGRDSNPGSVILEEVDAATTDSFTMVGNLVDITAKDSENGDINDLGGDGAEIVFHYTDAEMTAAGVTTESAMKLVYYDETIGAPVPFDHQVIDTATNTITGYLTHFTPVGIGNPPITISAPPVSPGGSGALIDSSAPIVSNVVVSAKATEATITWTTNETSWSWLNSGMTTNYGKEAKTEKFVSSHSVTITGLSADTTYHYQIKTKDSASNIGTDIDRTFVTLTTAEATKKAAEEAAVKKTITVTTPATTVVVIVIANAKPSLPTTATRDLAKEAAAIAEYKKITKKNPAKSTEWLIVTFLTYGGSDVTKALTAKDRSGLLADFKDIYGKLPVTDADWQNLAKMAQNVTPTKVAKKELQANKDFKKIFKRAVKFTNATEEKFVHMVTYRLRVTERDLNKEKVGLAKYRKVYKAVPKTSKDWAVVRALSYLDIK